MTYSLSNNCTKNYYNPTPAVQVIVEDVVTWIFLRHSVCGGFGYYHVGITTLYFLKFRWNGLGWMQSQKMDRRTTVVYLSICDKAAVGVGWRSFTVNMLQLSHWKKRHSASCGANGLVSSSLLCSITISEVEVAVMWQRICVEHLCQWTSHSIVNSNQIKSMCLQSHAAIRLFTR